MENVTPSCRLTPSFPMLHAGKAGGGPGVRRHARDAKGRSDLIERGHVEVESHYMPTHHDIVC